MKLTLKAARIEAGFTQQAVQQRTGIARSTLTRWEQYKTTPSDENRKALCAVYSIPETEIKWEK